MVCIGPGPGDPSDVCHKMNTIRRVLQFILDNNIKCLCVCLGLQCLAYVLGLQLQKKQFPRQGVQAEVSVFGSTELVGFYNSFFVKEDKEKLQSLGAEWNADDETGEVFCMRTATVCAFQFHPESILTKNGINILRDAITKLL
eukprot:GHVR01073600.1.p1 GENE.GHVR01073600.1~~GHVR01073600.1.p1  ORF type:complete len:143 (+),score=26.11 GHVR01073600.1:306-734(+)